MTILARKVLNLAGIIVLTFGVTYYRPAKGHKLLLAAAVIACCINFELLPIA